MIKRIQSGFVMLEVLIALALFASAGTALVVALNEVGDVTYELQRDRQLARILDSELRRVASLPRLQEWKENRALDELGLDLTVEVIPVEEDEAFQNQDGNYLTNIFKIRVTAAWFDQVMGEYETETVETWRYARLYQR